MVDAKDLRDASPWHPMSDPVDLKHVGKLLEELGEAVSAAARCLIQGIDEREPETGKLNREWLTDEMADVRTGFVLLEERFSLLRDIQREKRKRVHLQQWHNLA